MGGGVVESASGLAADWVPESADVGGVEVGLTGWFVQGLRSTAGFFSSGRGIGEGSGLSAGA
jgi:hypothetical protein